jgi:hypothetical protein
MKYSQIVSLLPPDTSLENASRSGTILCESIGIVDVRSFQQALRDLAGSPKM